MLSEGGRSEANLPAQSKHPYPHHERSTRNSHN
jgi:hypothetical protein